MTDSLTALLDKAIQFRVHLFNAPHNSAFRIFNGFSEGMPHLAIDLYGGTFLFHNYHPDKEAGYGITVEALSFIQKHPFTSQHLRTGIIKSHNSRSLEERRGKILFDRDPDRKIKEHGVWYAIDLLMNQDASFYLDTSNLRKWLLENLTGKGVLNTFAYTGSLGIAALAGDAKRVIQLDRNKRFLNLAKDSCGLNGLPIHKDDFITGDFFPTISRLKRKAENFDCVILDPPFFSTTTKGRVDQETEVARLINKVRPLINDGGCLIAINNAIYVSGSEYMHTLEVLCRDGYLKIKELIPVPEDFTGYPETCTYPPIKDPSPFNHSTKIVIMEVRKK